MQDGSFHNRSKPGASTGLVPNLQVKRSADSLRLRNPTEFGDYLHGQLYRLYKVEDFILLMLAGTRINKEFTPGERAGTSHSGSIYYGFGFGAASRLPSLHNELESRRFPRALHPGWRRNYFYMSSTASRQQADTALPSEPRNSKASSCREFAAWRWGACLIQSCFPSDQTQRHCQDEVLQIKVSGQWSNT